MGNIFQKSFDNITGTDIQNLIDIKYKECQRMEYKREMYGRGDEEKREMLRDISSIANAYGGFLIVGIEADDKSIPINSFNIDNAEKESDRIEKSCLSNIEPHISGLKCKTVKMDSGDNVIVFLIPRSLKKPHMINFKQLNQFWIRHNDRKHPMSIEEIRDACISVKNIWKDVGQFLDEREKGLREEITSRGGLGIGCAPALAREEFIDIRDSSIKNFLINPPNQHGEPFALSFASGSVPLEHPEPTLYGLRIKKKNFMEVQLFRSGYYELRVDRHLVYRKNQFQGVCVNEQALIEFTVNYFRALSCLVEQFGIESNVVGFICLYNVGDTPLKSKLIDPKTGHSYYPEKKLEKTTHLLIPSRQITSFDNPDAIAKSFLEKIWNAYGFEEVPDFKNDVYDPDEG